MDPSQRIVIRIPVSELWDSTGSLPVEKRRTLTTGEIASLLRQGRVRFVVADIGHRLEWIPLQQCYEFWKTEVKPRIADMEQFDLENFPDAYCYVASE
jgi:hypothetical protein